MSSIVDVIRELCPNGVEFRPLGELGEVFRGRRFVKSDYVEGGIGAIHYGQLYTHFDTKAFEVLTRVSDGLRPSLRFVKRGDLVIAEVGETVEDVGKAIAWLGDEDVAIHDGCYGFRHEMDPAFVSYYLQTPAFARQKNLHVARAKVKRLSLEGLKKIRIPAPPLEIQSGIAKVLDLFQSLDAELKAELSARRRQFDHYRDSLLRFTGRDDLAWLPMGEIGHFLRGKRFTKADYVDEDNKGIACIHYGEIYTHYGTSTNHALSRLRADIAPALRYAEPGDVILVDVGETVDEVGKAVAWLGGEKVAIHDHCYAFRHKMNPKFLSYVLQTPSFHSQKARHVARTKVKTLLLGGLAKVVIPVPSLAEQTDIVAALDAFDALVNDHTSGLPAELVARRKQYEHYRNRLLTFAEAV